MTTLDKVILAEIDSLDSTDRGCCASNEYLAKFCQCSVTKVSTSISRLINFGYLKTSSFDGRNRFIKSSLSKNESISKNESEPFKKRKADFQNLKPINIDNNINIISKENSIKESPKFRRPSVEEVREYCRERNNSVNAERFCDYYDTIGWKIGKAQVPMKDWKAAVRIWERNDSNSTKIAVKAKMDDDLDGIL